MFLYPFYKGLSAVTPYGQHPCAVLKAALSSGDLELLSLCFNFLTGRNYVLMY